MIPSLIRNIRVNRPISPLSLLFGFSEEWIQKRYGRNDVMKPPTVVILSHKEGNAEKWMSLLNNILSKDMYVIYEIKQEEFVKAHWMQNVSLLIMDNITDLKETDCKMLDKYVNNGGKTFVHCSLFPKIEGSDLNADGFFKISKERCVIHHKEQKCFEAFVQIAFQKIYDRAGEKTLCHANSNDSPVVSLYEKNHGKILSSALDFILSLYFDEDNELLQIDRRQIKSLLKYSMECLGLSCSVEDIKRNIKLTPGFLQGESMVVENFVSSLRTQLKAKATKSNGLQLKMIEANEEIEDIDATESIFPIVIKNKDSSKFPSCVTFNFEEYWRNLDSSSKLGRVMIYSPTVSSTQIILEKISALSSLSNGVVVVASQQTQGKGRGGNQWLSPEGCMMFSLAITIKISSKLGRRLPFLQHIAAVAFVNAVREIPGYEKINIGIKWPNDIYFGSNVKIGGLVATSSSSGDEFKVVIGIGVNVANKKPTICLNGIIEEFNLKNSTCLKPLSVESMIGLTITNIEKLIHLFQYKGYEEFCKLYYQYWLHSGQQIRIGSENGEHVTVQGLDENGFLSVKMANGGLLSLQPDGNSFDMMSGLITVKTR